MNTKYRFLNLAATIYRVVAWIVLVAGTVVSIATGVGSVMTIPAALLVSIAGIIISIVCWIGFLALADLFHLFIDVEQNTRETSEQIARLESRKDES